VAPGRKLGFRAGSRADYNRASPNIDPPAGRPGWRVDFEASRLESSRNPAREPDFRPGHSRHGSSGPVVSRLAGSDTVELGRDSLQRSVAILCSSVWLPPASRSTAIRLTEYHSKWTSSSHELGSLRPTSAKVLPGATSREQWEGIEGGGGRIRQAISGGSPQERCAGPRGAAQLVLPRNRWRRSVSV
jgi:hypothetical protein